MANKEWSTQSKEMAFLIHFFPGKYGKKCRNEIQKNELSELKKSPLCSRNILMGEMWIKVGYKAVNYSLEEEAILVFTHALCVMKILFTSGRLEIKMQINWSKKALQLKMSSILHKSGSEKAKQILFP